MRPETARFPVNQGGTAKMFPFRPFSKQLASACEDERGFFMDTDIAMKRRA